MFIHLDDDTDKFLLLMEMLHKLYALVNLQCCEDSPDALTHHELLLPGQLLVKFFKEKAEEAVHELGEQVPSSCIPCLVHNDVKCYRCSLSRL